MKQDQSLDSEIIRRRWKILRKIGQGAFGVIYLAEDLNTNERVAIKFEPRANKKRVLHVEAAILKRLQVCPYVCRFYGTGTFSNYTYLGMELQGKNLSELRRNQPHHRFSVATTALLGLSMLDALQALHENGFIHRDIKPSNFVIAAKKLPEECRARCILIDFGLSRRHLTSSGKIKEPRNMVGFRGTARYASIDSHQAKELSPKDDLFSFFYILVEFIRGRLPWSSERDKILIGKAKERFNDPVLLLGSPPQLNQIMSYLSKLQYYDQPNYDYIRGILKDIFNSTGELDDVPFDWERSTFSTAENIQDASIKYALSASAEASKAEVDVVFASAETITDGPRKLSISDNEDSDDELLDRQAENNSTIFMKNDDVTPGEEDSSSGTQTAEIPVRHLKENTAPSTPVRDLAAALRRRLIEVGGVINDDVYEVKFPENISPSKRKRDFF